MSMADGHFGTNPYGRCRKEDHDTRRIDETILVTWAEREVGHTHTFKQIQGQMHDTRVYQMTVCRVCDAPDQNVTIADILEGVWPEEGEEPFA